jgi:MoxR-like ATPase
LPTRSARFTLTATPARRTPHHPDTTLTEAETPDLLRALGWLDGLLGSAVAAMQAAHGPEHAADPYRGLYVSHPEAGALAAREPGAPPPFAADPPSGAPDGGGSRLARLRALAGLTDLDVGLLLVALAPELDLKYERVFAYLQDDVTRKRPTVDLALGLLAPAWEDRLRARARLSPTAPLLRHRLLRLTEDPGHRDPPLLSRYLKPEDRVVDFLLGSDELDPRLAPFARATGPRARLDALLLPEALRARLRGLACGAAEGVFYLQGPYGVGKRSVAEAVCAEAGRGLVVVDAGRMAGLDAAAFDDLAGTAAREALLRGAALYWEGFDALLADDRRAQRESALREAREGGLVFLAGEEGWQPADDLAGVPFYRVALPRPEYADRMRMWAAQLNGDGSAPGVDVAELANRFRFSGGQIRDAAAGARSLARLRDPEGGRLSMEDLNAACRVQSSPRLSSLARRITPRYGWDDIVLPPDRREQLREIANSMKYRSLVLQEWGFDRKLAMGKGLNVLFAGPPGTGKTMAAEIVAAELGLELFRIDLSGVVNKYIGETEKNLSRIFAEAETSSAILFFDEADALFGRRSEVRDSHDRYANLEVSYLLQRMEEYEGVVVLATNFRKNMDEAFVRRMHFTVDFPFPSERERLRIWEAVWPDELPRDPGIALDVVARRLELAGGNIRNVALAAAFLAADGGGVVTAEHLVRAARREYQKMGKVVSEAELRELERPR